MAMLLSLLTIMALIASMYAGHRFNMYLYARGAVGVRSDEVESVLHEVRHTRGARDGSLVQVRDYGLSYARTGILLFAIVMIALLFGVIILVASVL